MWQLYVLELENGCFYVGLALDVEKRFKEHALGLGANFTRLNKPIRVIEKHSCDTADKHIACESENKKTLEYALKYGGDKVKGGRHF